MAASPEALWDAAASLYPAHSLPRISKTLRLSHTKLKQYVKEPSPDLPIAAANHFIDLGVATSTRQCIVEMWQPNGNRMTVQSPGSPDLMKLGNAIKVLMYDGQGFWLCQKRLSKGRFSWWPGKAGTVVRITGNAPVL